MIKYLGSKVTMLGAIMAPVFILVPLLLGIGALCAEISVASGALFLGCLVCDVVWVLYIKNTANQLYSFGHFMSEGVQIITPFCKPQIIIYKKCFGCGIGYYTHGILNSQVGSKIYFIFLSYNAFDEYYRSRINLWKPTNTQIKVEFNKKVYDYLLTVLPKTQARKLVRDYQNMEMERRIRGSLREP